MSQVRVSSLPHSLSRPLSETPLARERLLPVHQALAPLFGLASGDPAPLALTRGHTVACVGSAAMSCALAVLVAPTQAGSWAGVVGLPSCGVQAAADLGVSLERTVFVPTQQVVRGHLVSRPMRLRCYRLWLMESMCCYLHIML